MIRVVGTHVSPFARKVLVALRMKGIDFELDPIVPFLASDAFDAVSPLRRIPVLIDGELVLNDSTVICEYLDEAYPHVPLMPGTPAERARARWIEEYADTRLADLMVWRLFFERRVRPAVFKEPTDEALVERTVAVDLPDAMDWLERQAPAAGFLFGNQLCTADIAVASVARNALLAGWTPDRWPRTAGWIARVGEVPAFAESVRAEEVMLSTRFPDQRAALEALGFRISEDTLAGRTPRPRAAA